MTKYHDKEIRRPSRVGEPVQVYLDGEDRDRLERLTAQLGATKSDILRRGLALLDVTSRRVPSKVPAVPLPTFDGQGLQPGVDLDDTAALRDLMGDADATG